MKPSIGEGWLSSRIEWLKSRILTALLPLDSLLLLELFCHCPSLLSLSIPNTVSNKFTNGLFCWQSGSEWQLDFHTPDFCYKPIKKRGQAKRTNAQIKEVRELEPGKDHPELTSNKKALSQDCTSCSLEGTNSHGMVERVQSLEWNLI